MDTRTSACTRHGLEPFPQEPPRLPLLQTVGSCFDADNLRGTLMIACQHLLGTTRSLFHSLFAAGLHPSDVSVIGKCYSTNTDVLREMRADGIDVDPASERFAAHESFDRTFRRDVRALVRRQLATRDLSRYRRVLVLDDGGELIKVVDELLGRRGLDVVGVEQTTSGYDKLRAAGVGFPVVNVARSEAKLQIESPMIADSVVGRTVELLQGLDTVPKRILIIGNGAIGRQLYLMLHRDHEVVRFDVDQARSDVPCASFETALSEADVVIGCTGRRVLGQRHHRMLKPGVFLVSASSSDREFDAVHLRRRIPAVTSCHADLEIDGIRLANCGFPVNFRGERDSIVPELIQITRALLAAAVHQAATMPRRAEPGFVDVDPVVHARIVGAWHGLSGMASTRRAAS